MRIVTAILKIGIAILIAVIFSSCAAQSKAPRYAVRKVEHIKGNAYLVTTDSFKVVRHVRGAGRYKPDSVSKIGIQ